MLEFVRGEEGAESEVLVVPVFAEATPGPGAASLIEGWGSPLTAFWEGADFTGKAGQVASLPAPAGDAKAVVFVGLGDEVDAEGLRRAAAVAARATRRWERVATTLHQVDIDGAAEAVAFGFALGLYRFDKYRSDPTPPRLATLEFVGADEEALAGARRGAVVAAAVAFARDLINEPAVAKPPAVIAHRAVELAERHGIAARVYDETEFRAERFGGLEAVNAGSTQPGRMVVLDYRPEGATRHLVFVGKGIVFDSGGLSLKPASSMEAMKTDMSGAAAVLAALDGIATLGIPVNVTAITPLTENLVSGNALRPGDVFRARNGTTVEVLNTDAEGRLVLADGLSLAAEASPDLIVDVATLTGACASALGPKIGGLFASDDETAAALMAAAASAGEKLWRLPLEAEYRAHIDSKVADIKNTGERRGGAISAAWFLAEFVGDHPWAHLDIAGPARAGKAEHYVTEGGTGFGVRTLIELAASQA